MHPNMIMFIHMALTKDAWYRKTAHPKLNIQYFPEFQYQTNVQNICVYLCMGNIAWIVMGFSLIFLFGEVYEWTKLCYGVVACIVIRKSSERNFMLRRTITRQQSM